MQTTNSQGDMSQYKSDSLEISRRSMEIILNTSQDGLCVIDPNTCKIVFGNKILSYYLNMNESSSPNKCPVFLFDGEISCTDCPIKLSDLNNLKNDKEISKEYYIEKSKKWLNIKYIIIKWIDGETAWLVRISDITSQKKHELEIHNLAYNDQLLNIPNRLQFDKDITKILKTKSHGVVILIDLDNFKYINDTYGHDYGDLILKSICAFVKSLKSPDIFFYRFSGNEFAIIMNNADEKAVHKFCNKLLERFRLPWNVLNEHQYCTASFGVTLYPNEGNTLNQLLKHSDIAMFTSKSNGKNTITYFSEELNDSFTQRVKIEECLRNAIASSIDEFELYYQPVMNIVTDKCIGAEALLRWNSRELGLLYPNQFIHIVEDIGFIFQLGAHILDTACKQLKEWHNLFDKEFKMNINVSNRQLQNDKFLHTVRSAIDKNGLSSRFIVLEITENVNPREIGTINETLSLLKNIGIDIAMDDFGTGYSSLNNIMNMSIDIIKIDRSFISNITSDKLQVTFVKSITNLSQIMHKKVYIEGVETLDQLNVLKCMGNITTVQGYYYSKPLTSENFVSWYKNYCD